MDHNYLMNPDSHALRPCEDHSSRPFSSANIDPSNSFSICIFLEKQGLEKNQGSWQSCNRVDIEIKEQIEFDVDTAYIKV